MILVFPYANGVDGHSEGIEIAPQWDAASWLRIKGSYSYLRIDLANEAGQYGRRRSRHIRRIEPPASAARPAADRCGRSRWEIDPARAVRQRAARAAGRRVHGTVDLRAAAGISRSGRLVGERPESGRRRITWSSRHDPGPAVAIRRAAYAAVDMDTVNRRRRVRPRSTRRWRAWLVVVPVAHRRRLLGSALHGQPASESQVKAVYLLNFARFTTWPAGTSGPDVFAVCVLGSDPFGPILDTTLAGETVDGKPTVVRRIARCRGRRRMPRGLHQHDRTRGSTADPGGGREGTIADGQRSPGIRGPGRHDRVRARRAACALHGERRGGRSLGSDAQLPVAARGLEGPDGRKARTLNDAAPSSAVDRREADCDEHDHRRRCPGARRPRLRPLRSNELSQQRDQPAVRAGRRSWRPTACRRCCSTIRRPPKRRWLRCRAAPNVESAEIDRADGRLFAAYRRGAGDPPPVSNRHSRRGERSVARGRPDDGAHPAHRLRRQAGGQRVDPCERAGSDRAAQPLCRDHRHGPDRIARAGLADVVVRAARDLRVHSPIWRRLRGACPVDGTTRRAPSWKATRKRSPS